MKTLFLKIFHKGELVGVKPFTEAQLSIGGGEGLSLKLDGLPPWQCLIEEKNNQYKIFNLESDIGTFLNGEEVKAEKDIKSGDTITVSDYSIQFFIGAPPSQSDDSTSPQVQKQKPIPVPTRTNQQAFNQKTNTQDVTTDLDVSASDLDVSASAATQKFNKKSWNTFAPPSRVKNLDEYLEPSIGNLIEVIVAWKERVLSVSHFSKAGDIYLGSSSDCSVTAPTGMPKYKLLTIKGGARIFLNSGVTGLLIQGKNKSTRVSTELSGNQDITLKPYEIVRVNFRNSLCAYVRIQTKPQKIIESALFRLKKTESAILLFSVLLTAAVVFYGAVYAPIFLLDDAKLIEEKIRIARVQFEITPTPPATDYKLTQKTTVAKRKGKKKKTVVVKKIQKKTIIKPKTRRVKKPKIGKLKTTAPFKKKKRVRKQIKSGSSRPGGSLKTGQTGSSPKTVAPDPTKMGLLGVFGGGGQLKKLDKGASGNSAGGILGLAESATGFSGTPDSYSGTGIGTKTKDVSIGGQGSSFVGISNIKTKGRGDSLLKGANNKGALGVRGQVNIDTGADDIEVEGEIDREAILRAIRKNRNQFDRCYQAVLQRKASAQGHLKMQWQILSSGQGSNAQAISDGVGSPELSRCVSAVLENIIFPAPPSGQIPRISFKFIFSI